MDELSTILYINIKTSLNLKVLSRHHWRLSYTNPPNFVRRFDNLEQFSYKNIQPPISLRLEMTSQSLVPYFRKCQKFHLFCRENLVTLSQTDVSRVFSKQKVEKNICKNSNFFIFLNESAMDRKVWYLIGILVSFSTYVQKCQESKNTYVDQ